MSARGTTAGNGDAAAEVPRKPTLERVQAADRSASGGAASPGVDMQEMRMARLPAMAAACRTIIEALGEDPARPGLERTPERMAKALLESTTGYADDAGAILRSALFDVDAGGGMVLVRDIEFHSLCEHHMLPFFGSIHVAYLPGERVVGLSKLARVADVFSKRLQVQERITRQIADAVMEHVGARGCAVVVEASHLCMCMRGASKPGSMTTTSCFRGVFAEDDGLRREFLAQLRPRP